MASAVVARLPVAPTAEARSRPRHRRLGTLLAPAALLAGVTTSLLAWPLSAAAGIPGLPSARPEPAAVGAIAAFYVGLLLCALAGTALGSAVPPVRAVASASWTVVYHRLSAVAIVGVALTYLLATRGDPGVVLDLLAEQQLNLLREQIPYEAGLATLRYATIPAGGLALHRVLGLRRASALDGANLVALLLSAAIASRLSLMAAVATGLFLAVARPLDPGSRRPARRRRSRRRLVVLGLLGLAAMVVLNYGRNANYYRDVVGVSNPVTMMGYEAARYVAVPARVSVAVEGSGEVSTLSGPGRLGGGEGLAHYGTPTYLAGEAPPPGKTAYRDVVEVEGSLTTNSVAAEAAGTLGRWSLPVLGSLVAVFALLAAHGARYRSPVLLVCPVIAYAFLELWRTWLFNAGFVHFIVLAVVLCSVHARRSGPDRLFPT